MSWTTFLALVAVGNGAANDLAFLQGVAHLLAQGAAFFFQNDATGNDHVVALAVELQNLEGKNLTDQGVQILDRAQINLGIGQEGRYADINRPINASALYLCICLP